MKIEPTRQRQGPVRVEQPRQGEWPGKKFQNASERQITEVSCEKGFRGLHANGIALAGEGIIFDS
jgi:uncharacterized protein (DUF2141 family)